MGNRAVITTPDKKVGVYMHWNGGRDSVNAILTYCKLHGYRRPEDDDYGWARLCQVISNFIDTEGTSVGIDLYEHLDTDNGDNGVYIIKDWEIIGREFFDGEEQNDYDLIEFLKALDESMPENHRIGDRMILDLLRTNRSIQEVGYNYLGSAKQNANNPGFEIGRRYRSHQNEILVKGRPDEDHIIIELNGEDIETDVFHWKDGKESVIVKTESWYESSITSTEVMS